MNRKLVAVIAIVVLGVIGAIGYVTLSRLRGDIADRPRTATAAAGQSPARAAGPEAQAQAQASIAAARASLPGLAAATTRAPQDATAWVRLGDTAMQAAQSRTAIGAYRHALAIDPGKASVWSSLGEVYVGSIRSQGPHMPPPARAAFDKAIAIDPTDLRARFYLAGEKDANGQHDAAMSEWLAILAAVPGGSPPDRAVRTAITLSVQHQAADLKQRLAAAVRAQPHQ